MKRLLIALAVTLAGMTLTPSNAHAQWEREIGRIYRWHLEFERTHPGRERPLTGRERRMQHPRTFDFRGPYITHPKRRVSPRPAPARVTPRPSPTPGALVDPPAPVR